MKLAIFGATGATGAELVKQALEHGHTVTALVRNPAALVEQERFHILSGDVRNPADVEKAVQGQEAVICALGARDLKSTMIRTEGTRTIIDAMKKSSIKRLFVISAMGVGESWKTLSLINKAFFAILLKSARIDHEAQEATVKASELDWTIIRPSGLVNTPRTGVYRVGENILAKTSQIARADVADLILKELQQNALIGKAITITN